MVRQTFFKGWGGASWRERLHSSENEWEFTCKEQAGVAVDKKLLRRNIDGKEFLLDPTEFLPKAGQNGKMWRVGNEEFDQIPRVGYFL